MKNLKDACHTQDQAKVVEETDEFKKSEVTVVKDNEGKDAGELVQIDEACVISNKIRELRDKIAANAQTQKKFLKEFASDPSQDQVSDKFDQNLIYDGTIS